MALLISGTSRALAGGRREHMNMAARSFYAKGSMLIS
jgi:hypothetical protein